MQARIASAQQQLQATIYKEQRLRRALADQPGTSLELLQLNNHIQIMQRDLADLPARLSRDISDKVEGAGRNGFTATLVDGTEFNALHAEYADNLDLAMFKLRTSRCPYVESSRSRALNTKSRDYAGPTGSPPLEASATVWRSSVAVCRHGCA
jgi:hypothetical protein